MTSYQIKQARYDKLDRLRKTIIKEMIALHKELQREDGINYAKFIIATTASHLKINPVVMLNGVRRREVVDARHIAMKLIHQYTDLTVVQIGVLMRKDHSTVLHGYKKADDLYETDPRFRNKMDMLRMMVEAS